MVRAHPRVLSALIFRSLSVAVNDKVALTARTYILRLKFFRTARDCHGQSSRYHFALGFS